MKKKKKKEKVFTWESFVISSMNDFIKVFLHRNHETNYAPRKDNKAFLA